MATVIVNPGACGFDVTIIAEKQPDGRIAITLDTKCDMVKKMLADIADLDEKAVFMKFANNPVYLSASKHLTHAACSVPSAILKTVEVEAGLNVAKDVSIAFVKKSGERKDSG
jgi:hypothetical protein